MAKQTKEWDCLVHKRDKEYFCDINSSGPGGFQSGHRWLKAQFDEGKLLPPKFDGTYYTVHFTKDGLEKLCGFLTETGGYTDRMRKCFGKFVIKALHLEDLE